MINLIPQYAKKKITIEYWVRVVSIWCIIWSIALIISTSFLLPTYVLIKTQTGAYMTSSIEASEKVSDYQKVTSSLTQANERAQIILREIQQPHLSDYVNMIKNVETKDVSVTDISVKRVVEGVSPINVMGLADSRQALASFRERILQIPSVESVDLPISNLAKDKDIQYNITVTIKKDHE
jgi:hypothetical protein